MTKNSIEKIVEACFVEFHQTIGDSAEIEGEGVFDGSTVKGYLAVDDKTGKQETVMVGESSKFGGGVKISKKVLFPKDEMELREFLEIIFSPEEK